LFLPKPIGRDVFFHQAFWKVNARHHIEDLGVSCSKGVVEQLGEGCFDLALEERD
jgi:hypothetical protein